MTFALKPEVQERIDRTIARYPKKSAAMLPVLWIVQGSEGWISTAAMEWVAERLECSPASVQSVVTFYTMLDDRPVGRHKLQVCRTLSCELMGARRIIDTIRDKLGIGPGETTRDGLFTLQEVECLASCGTAPVMQCNWKYYENLTPARIEALLEALADEPRQSEDDEPVIYERPTLDVYREIMPEGRPATKAPG